MREIKQNSCVERGHRMPVPHKDSPPLNLSSSPLTPLFNRASTLAPILVGPASPRLSKNSAKSV